MELQKSSLLGLPISKAQSMSQSLALIEQRLSARKSCIVSFINPYAFDLRWHNQAYANALWHFDLVLPDGIGVVKALRWINGVDVARQSFDATSLFHPILNLLNLERKSLCLIGGEPGIAKRAQQKMCQAYPHVDYLGALDGFRPFQEIVDWVVTQDPDVVLVGMGAPMQESLLLRLRCEGFSGVGFTCGGFLDQYVVDSQYYPAFIDRLDLRWLYRLLREPRRLGRRYLVQYQTFIFDVFGVLLARIAKRQNLGSHLWLARRYASLESQR